MIKQSETFEICQRAKTRKDGVYSYRGYLYLVKNNHLYSIADYGGQIYQFFGSFFVGLGKVERYDRRKNLLNMLNNS